MRSGTRLLLLLPLAGFLACGSNSSSITTGGGFGAPTGNWVLTVSPYTASASTFVGSLIVQGTSASGVFRFNDTGAQCVSGTQDIPFSGSVVNNVLTLTSGTFSSGVATATIQLPLVTNTTGITSANGTIKIAGGTCALSSAPLVAAYVSSVTGTWTAALTGSNDGTATIGLTQAAANADGQFPITGAITFTSKNCSFATPVTATGLVSGYSLQLASGNALTLSVNLANIPYPISLTVTGTSIACPGTYSGTVTSH